MPYQLHLAPVKLPELLLEEELLEEELLEEELLEEELLPVVLDELAALVEEELDELDEVDTPPIGSRFISAGATSVAK